MTLLVGCGGGAPEIDAPDLDGTQAAACQRLLDALPDTVNDQPKREVEPSDAPGAAWGDPPIVLTCGVEVPEEYDELSPCEEADGVGWFVPSDQVDDQGADVTLTAVGLRPVVELQVPADYRPAGVAAALTDLAPAVLATLDEVQACF